MSKPKIEYPFYLIKMKKVQIKNNRKGDNSTWPYFYQRNQREILRRRKK